MTKAELSEALRKAFIAGREYGRAEVQDLWDVQENRLHDYEMIVAELCARFDNEVSD